MALGMIIFRKAPYNGAFLGVILALKLVFDELTIDKMLIICFFY